MVKFDTQCKIGDFPFTLLTTDYRKSKHYLETGYKKSKHHWSTMVHNIKLNIIKVNVSNLHYKHYT